MLQEIRSLLRNNQDKYRKETNARYREVNHCFVRNPLLSEVRFLLVKHLLFLNFCTIPLGKFSFCTEINWHQLAKHT